MQTSPSPPSFDQRAKQAAAVTADSGQYLTLRLGGEDYAIDIMRVQEIRSYEEPTRMANSPSFIKGVINLRGVIVPIVDLRMKLNISKVDYTEFTVVINVSSNTNFLLDVLTELDNERAEKQGLRNLNVEDF